MSVTAVILAGGKSSRFGQDKTLLELNGKPIVATIAESCRAFSDQILLVSNQTDKFSIENTIEIRDNYAGCGPLGGMQAGLAHAKNDTVFVTACDLPFFNLELAELLLARLPGYEAAIPREKGKAHPLFGAYNKAILPKLEEWLENKQYAVWQFCKSLSTCYLDKENWPASSITGKGLYNINYPADYAQIAETS